MITPIRLSDDSDQKPLVQGISVDSKLHEVNSQSLDTISPNTKSPGDQSPDAQSSSQVSIENTAKSEPLLPAAQQPQSSGAGQVTSHENVSAVLNHSRLRRQRQSCISDRFHLKQDRGAIVDIEFIAQFAVLCFSHDHPDPAVR